MQRISQLLIIIAIFSGIFIPGNASAMLKLKISLTHKLGIDKNLVLKSELHSIEEFLGNEEVVVVMRNGFELKLNANYIEELGGVGPTDIIQVKVSLFSPNGTKIKEFTGEEAKIRLWKSKKFIYSGNVGQQIEIIIVPEPN